jgi:hypothetical protein
MRRWAVALALVLIWFSVRVEGQELRLGIQRNADNTVTVTVLDTGGLKGHTFIEASTNDVWFPAYFSSSNSTEAVAYRVTNTGAMRLFRGARGESMARQVKASWERLGVTNYVFRYEQECICPMVAATVTVRSNEVVKVEDARDVFGNPMANPSLEGVRTIDELFDAWILAEPDGGQARELEFDTNGFPKVIYIDSEPLVIDEELIFRIGSFTPLP